MKYLILFSTFLLTAGSSFAESSYEKIIKDMPKDVVSIVDRKIGCNYWAGEMPDKANDPAVKASGRPQMIEKELKKFNCAQLDRDEKVIRKKYQEKKNIQKAIDQSSSLSPGDLG